MKLTITIEHPYRSGLLDGLRAVGGLVREGFNEGTVQDGSQVVGSPGTYRFEPLGELTFTVEPNPTDNVPVPNHE